MRHKISGILGELEVNSFHNQACRIIKEPLEILAQSDDRVIEAVKHNEKCVLGTMWHSEREEPFRVQEIQWLRDHFG